MNTKRFSLNCSVALFCVVVGLSFRRYTTTLAFATHQPFVPFKHPPGTSGLSGSTRLTSMRSSKGDETEEQGPLSSSPPSPPPDPNSEAGSSFRVATRNPLRLLVLRLGFTEPAWTSPLNYGEKDGNFRCAYCGLDLFDSDAKYDSGSGWPSFWRSIKEGSVSYKREFDGRLECRCGRCKSHLGHVFLDGPSPGQVPQDLLDNSPSSDPRSGTKYGALPRFCINGASLRFTQRDESD